MEKTITLNGKKYRLLLDTYESECVGIDVWDFDNWYPTCIYAIGEDGLAVRFDRFHPLWTSIVKSL